MRCIFVCRNIVVKDAYVIIGEMFRTIGNKKTRSSILHREDAFTIVELLIVVVVIAILAAITTVSYFGIQSQARKSAHAAEMTQVVKQIQIAAVQGGLNSPVIEPPRGYIIRPSGGAGQGFTQELLDPIVDATELSIYVRFDATGQQVASWDHIFSLRPTNNNTNGFSIRVGSPESTSINLLIGTQTLSNAASHINNVRDTTDKYVCWGVAQGTTVQFGCNNRSNVSRVIPAHPGWSFSTIALSGISDINSYAGVVFAEHHDQGTRDAITEWLFEQHP